MLVRVLPDWEFGKIELHAGSPAGKAAEAAAQGLTEFLIVEFAKITRFS
ncbi:hypothetical protein V1291_003972 [Nitrobacteraceae bacterium AZCC 1564]